MPLPADGPLVLSGEALGALHDAQEALLAPQPARPGALCRDALRRLFTTPHVAPCLPRLAAPAPPTSFSRCARTLDAARRDVAPGVFSTREDPPEAAFFRRHGFKHVLWARAQAGAERATLYVAYAADADRFDTPGRHLLYLLLPALHACAARSQHDAAPADTTARGRLPSLKRIRARLGLTAREAEVALLVAEGLTSKEIAQRLGVSPHTARRHGEKVLEKLGLHARSGVGLALMRLG